MNIVATEAFEKERRKECRKLPPSFSKKITRALKNLKGNPFQGKKVRISGERRIWIGTTHRLFYDIEDKDIVLLRLKKKNKGTYRD